LIAQGFLVLGDGLLLPVVDGRAFEQVETVEILLDDVIVLSGRDGLDGGVADLAAVFLQLLEVDQDFALLASRFEWSAK